MKVKVQKDGRITPPKNLREQACIREGQWLQITLHEDQILLHAAEVTEADLKLSEAHPVWELVGKWASGHTDISHNKYTHLAQAYGSKQ